MQKSDAQIYVEGPEYNLYNEYAFNFDKEQESMSIEENGQVIWSDNVQPMSFPIMRLYQCSGSNSWSNIDAEVKEVEVDYIG